MSLYLNFRRITSKFTSYYTSEHCTHTLKKIVVPMTPVYCVLSYHQNYIWVNDTADYALVNITVAIMRADHLQDIKVTLLFNENERS